MRIIEVKFCWQCPLHRAANGIYYCDHAKYSVMSGKIFTDSDETDNFPKFCPLKEI